MTFFSEKRIGGVIAIIFGVIALLEANSLYTYSLNLLTGDHALPGLIGVMLVLVGISLFFGKQEENKVVFPTGKLLLTIIATILFLFMYCFLITVIGYVFSTLVASVLLIKLIGKKSWILSLITGGVITAFLYYVFIVLLNTPFPSGLFLL